MKKAILQVALICALLPGATISAAPAGDPAGPRLAFIGLHGGVLESLREFQEPLGIQVDAISDREILEGTADLSSYRLVLLQHLRGESRDRYRRLFGAAKQANPGLRILSISGGAEQLVPDLLASGVIERDPQLARYYGSSSENLRRLLVYLLVTYLGRDGTVEAPEELALDGLYHPEHDGLFADVDAFMSWSGGRDSVPESTQRVAVVVHQTHLLFQQPRVVDALIGALERRGLVAAAVVDSSPRYQQTLLEFDPAAVIHTCHSKDSVEFREQLDVPHLHSLFFRDPSIDGWRAGPLGVPAKVLSFQVVSQELLGAIEPQVGAGTVYGGGGPEAFSPIPERIEHLAQRTARWVRLASKQNSEKKVAFIYYDRELGQAELMRGSATGMFLNGPRSMVKVLQEMSGRGYDLSRVPTGEDQLIDWMMKQGRQIGLWAPETLARLAQSGRAVLVPVEQYRRWFESRVPEQARKKLIQSWGPPPGKLLVWRDGEEEFLVIPRIDLGNVILLPQPLRGEAHDDSKLHDKLVPPPHNYLATYFWLEQEFGADALVHFGTHGSEFLLPGRGVGLNQDDWSDIVLGSTPNINPWVINNLGESSPARRRAYAVLVDHQVPPSVNAELSDELLNLHNDVDKWMVLEDGALRRKFRESISTQVLEQHLDQDLGFDLAERRLLSPEEVEQLLAYLHEIHNETTPVSLHVLGEPPAEELLSPYLVTCLGSRFLEALGALVAVPPGEQLTPGDRAKYLRGKAEAAVQLVVRGALDDQEAVQAVGGELPSGGLSEELSQGFQRARTLSDGFAQTDQEIEGLFRALSGRFLPPGPGNSPDRNPAVLPTGRNLYVMNPEELPTRPSFELGKLLVDQLLQSHLSRKGRYPQKVAFTLNSFATFQDYGVMESQILYLMGIRPVWDARNLVIDVELIPAEELGRPRIDVFVSALGYYRDMLPTRMRLLDKAIRLAASTDEPDNQVFQNSTRVRDELLRLGLAGQRAQILSRARIFGRSPGSFGSAGYYYLVERSGDWDSREELIKIYLEQVRYVYTEQLWGVESPRAFERQIQGSDVLLRTWADRTRSPLSNKYVWYKGGSLSLAIEQLTGQEPEFYLSDVRDPDRARIVDAEAALRQDYRVRLFNRKWIEGMMKEGYAGADQVAVHVSNTLGWRIMRESSVSADIWEQIVEIYLRDSKQLNIREWFEAENPFAFQEVTEILLETTRKGYWQPDDATLQEIAAAYADSVARHGEGGGLRGGGNQKLEAFVKQILTAPGDEHSSRLLARMEARRSADRTPTAVAGERPLESEPMDQTSQVEGARLDPVPTSSGGGLSKTLLVGLIALLAVLMGAWRRAGGPA